MPLLKQTADDPKEPDENKTVSVISPFHALSLHLCVIQGLGLGSSTDSNNAPFFQFHSPFRALLFLSSASATRRRLLFTAAIGRKGLPPLKLRFFSPAIVGSSYIMESVVSYIRNRVYKTADITGILKIGGTCLLGDIIPMHNFRNQRQANLTENS